MKLLLTSSGIKNASIRDALVALLGKPLAESNALTDVLAKLRDGNAVVVDPRNRVPAFGEHVVRADRGANP